MAEELLADQKAFRFIYYLVSNTNNAPQLRRFLVRLETQIHVLWDVTPCRLVNSCRRFGGS